MKKLFAAIGSSLIFTGLKAQTDTSKLRSFILLKGILITGLSVFFISPVTAQKEKGQSLITQDQIRQINEIVKPLRDQFDKQLSQDETYAAYLDDVRKIKEAKSMEEKRSLTAKLDGKYLAYFKKVWSAANIDEKSYQQKIRGVFPDNIGRMIQFEPFLNFSFLISSFLSLPPVTQPQEPDKCLDICTIAAGEITGTYDLISGGGGSYGNCFLKTNAWSSVYGRVGLNGYLRNNITIPGSFPNDGRKLRIKISYELKQEATSFAAPGVGFAETGLTTYQSSESLLACSPLLGRSHAERTKTVNEEYTLAKNDVAKSIFQTYANVGSFTINGSLSSTECTSIKWTICEEH